MIDVGGKKITKRSAVAEAFINLSSSTKEKIYKLFPHRFIYLPTHRGHITDFRNKNNFLYRKITSI